MEGKIIALDWVIKEVFCYKYDVSCKGYFLVADEYGRENNIIISFNLFFFNVVLPLRLSTLGANMSSVVTLSERVMGQIFSRLPSTIFKKDLVDE